MAKAIPLTALTGDSQLALKEVNTNTKKYGEDGKLDAKDEDGNDFPVVKVRYDMDCGLCVRDWRYGARIANISMAALNGATPPDLFDLMCQAYYRVRDFLPSAKWCIYVNPAIYYFLHKQARKEQLYTLSRETYQGAPVWTYLGIPIRSCKAIKVNEAKVPQAVK